MVLSQELSSNDRNVVGAQGQHTFSIQARDDFIHFHINTVDCEGLCCHSQLRRGSAKPPWDGAAAFQRSSRHGHWRLNSYKCPLSWNILLPLILVNHLKLKKKNLNQLKQRAHGQQLTNPDLGGSGTSFYRRRGSGQRGLKSEQRASVVPGASYSNQIHSLPDDFLFHFLIKGQFAWGVHFAQVFVKESFSHLSHYFKKLHFIGQNNESFLEVHISRQPTVVVEEEPEGSLGTTAWADDLDEALSTLILCPLFSRIVMIVIPTINGCSEITRK